MKRTITISLFLLCLTLSLAAQKTVKIACVGNSITAGFGLQHPEKDAYPIVLGRMFGSGYDVRNFGVSGATMLDRGDYPYMQREAYQAALDFEPDIVTIKLGTNDSKPQNWRYKSEFARDMGTMIEAFKKLKSHPKIYLCFPATAYAIQWGINNDTIEKSVIPIIKKIASRYKLKTIDTHKATRNMKMHFKDNIHPDVEGSQALAAAIYKKIARYAQSIR